MTEAWQRLQRAAAVDVGGDAVVLVGRDGRVHRLDGDSAVLARVVLARLARPASADDVVAHVEALAGPLGDRRAVIEQLLALLVETGAIAAPPRPTPAAGANIVVAITGAIAATQAPAFVLALQRRGHTVEVALTPTAARFVAVDALAAIVQREPHTSLWPRAPHAPVPHVALAAWAELVVIYPASATTIHRIAHGDFSELVAAIALTTRAPVVVAPSMNPAMLAAPAVQRNLDQLRADGRLIVHGVPSQEVADAPALRETVAGAAPAPGELATTIDALRAAGVIDTRPSWNAAYRGELVPWASDTCDPDLAAALAAHAPPPGRLLDVGCGLGQVARHAATAGYRVVATDVSEVALARARAHGGDVVWLRDDIRATALAGPFDVIVDRASLHGLPPGHAAAWAASIRRLAAPSAIVIVKCHERGVPGATTGWTGEALAALLPGFALAADAAAELPGLADATPIPSRLVVLRAPGVRSSPA